MTTITVDRAVLEQVLEALEPRSRICKRNAAIEALNAELAQQEQEPMRPTVQEIQNAAANLKLMKEMFGASESQQEQPQYTTGHCKERAKPNGCQLHNLQCGYPECDRKPAALAQPLPDPVDEYRKGFIDGQIDMRDRPEEQEQAEPVLVVEKEPDYMSRGHFYEGSKPFIDPTEVWKLPIGTKLYTHPPRREWQSLTADAVFANDKIMALNASLGLKMDQLMDLVCAVEQALKEKNNG